MLKSTKVTMTPIVRKCSKSCKNNKEKYTELWKILACGLVCIGGFSQGVMFGWNIPFLSQMQNPNIKTTLLQNTTEPHQNTSIDTVKLITDINSHGTVVIEDIVHRKKVDASAHEDIVFSDSPHEAACSSSLSWISSSQNLGSVFGALLSGPLLLLFHPHRLIPILSLATSLSWFLTAHNPDSDLWITIGKGLVGLFITLQANYSPKYITNIAPNKYGSTLSCIFVVARNLGLVLTASSNLYLSYANSWVDMTYIYGVAPPIITTLFFFLLPKDEKTPPPTSQASESTNNNTSNKVTIAIISSEDVKRKEKKKKSGLSRIFHLVFLVSAMSLSGVVPISSFVSYFLASPSSLTNVYTYSASTASLSFLICGFLGSVISTMITARVGTRPTLLVTTFLLTLSTTTISTYYLLVPSYEASAFVYYIPFVIFNVFYLTFGIGIGTLFSVILGDTLPKSGQPLTYPFIFGWLHILNFAQNYCFPLIVCQFQFAGIGITFVGHSCINIVSFIFVYYNCDAEQELEDKSEELTIEKK